jgi:hypothetical protein
MRRKLQWLRVWTCTGQVRLSEVVQFLRGEISLELVRSTNDWSEAKFADQDLDFGEVKIQQHVKRAVEVAAAGGRKILDIDLFRGEHSLNSLFQFPFKLFHSAWGELVFNVVSEEDTRANGKKGDKPTGSKRFRTRYWNPAEILLLFRDGHATDLSTLIEALRDYLPFAIPPEERSAALSSATIPTIMTVEELIDAGLLQADDPTDRELQHTKIGVTPLLRKIQDALRLRLTFLANVDLHGTMRVEPLFGIPDTIVEKLDVFVLMPFKADILPVYEDHIKPTCASLELTVWRGDDFFTAHAVVQDIWKAIVSARLIVADCTDRNPNVFYEIGLAQIVAGIERP